MIRLNEWLGNYASADTIGTELTRRHQINHPHPFHQATLKLSHSSTRLRPHPFSYSHLQLSPNTPTQDAPLSNLRQILRRIALIRAHHLPINKLLIRIRRIHNRPAIHNRQRLEATPVPKLSTPAAADGVGAAQEVIVAGARGRVAGHGVGAGRGRTAAVGVDAEGVIAGRVACVAGADEGLDGPLRGGGCHH